MCAEIACARAGSSVNDLSAACSGSSGEGGSALTQFPSVHSSHSWNVSLFHYRNHGADIGRVLVGLQVPDCELVELHNFLQQLGCVACHRVGGSTRATAITADYPACYRPQSLLPSTRPH
jgi:hypothetical protein